MGRSLARLCGTRRLPPCWLGHHACRLWQRVDRLVVGGVIHKIIVRIRAALECGRPRTEIQLLRYHHPDPLSDPHIRDLYKLGMNHVCFAVDDIEAEVAKFRAGGFKTRNEIMDFHSRKLVFLDGPEGVTVELSQWH